MKASGPDRSLSTSNPLSQILWLICLVSCFLLSGDPAGADTSSPTTTRGVYVPAPTVRVPELRQRMLSEAQKVATDARLRLQVSGAAPTDPSKVVVVKQSPEPNTVVPAGTTVTVTVQAPAARQTEPSDTKLSQRVTVVPELLKRPLSEAKPLVANARLKLEVSGGSPEDTSHAIVVEQKPSPGTRVLAGTTVVVAVQMQRTEEWVIVPDLRPRSLAIAQRVVNAARLKLEVSGGWPEDTGRASIVDQKPPAGTRVRVGSTVIVTVRTQPIEEGTTVPDLRSQLLLEAQRRVNRARLRLEIAGGSPADPLLAMVVDQKPAPGTRVPLDSVVVVGVRSVPGAPQIVTPPAAMPPQITSPPAEVLPPRVVSPPRDEWTLVPALRQRPLMDALQRVRNARLKLEVTGGWPSDPAHAVVVEQQPAPDTRVRPGDSVTVQVLPAGQAQRAPSAPPQAPPSPPPAQQLPSPQPPPLAPSPRAELVMVPELRQQLLPEARHLTTGARLELRVRGQSPTDETRALVVTQRPAAGTRVTAKSIVLVELGPALIVVPDLRQHPLDEARQILSKAGFELAVMGDAPSSESRAQVVEQTPLPGARAAVGSTVTVRAKVSRLTTWVIAGAGALLAAGAALGIARWRGVRSHPSTALPAVRVVASADVGTQEVRSNGAAAGGFAIRLRGRIDGGAQTVEADARIVAEARRSDG